MRNTKNYKEEYLKNLQREIANIQTVERGKLNFIQFGTSVPSELPDNRTGVEKMGDLQRIVNNVKTGLLEIMEPEYVTVVVGRAQQDPSVLRFIYAKMPYIQRKLKEKYRKDTLLPSIFESEIGLMITRDAIHADQDALFGAQANVEPEDGDGGGGGGDGGDGDGGGGEDGEEEEEEEEEGGSEEDEGGSEEDEEKLVLRAKKLTTKIANRLNYKKGAQGNSVIAHDRNRLEKIKTRIRELENAGGASQGAAGASHGVALEGAPPGSEEAKYTTEINVLRNKLENYQQHYNNNLEVTEDQARLDRLIVILSELTKARLGPQGAAGASQMGLDDDSISTVSVEKDDPEVEKDDPEGISENMLNLINEPSKFGGFDNEAQQTVYNDEIAQYRKSYKDLKAKLDKVNTNLADEDITEEDKLLNEDRREELLAAIKTITDELDDLREPYIKPKPAPAGPAPVSPAPVSPVPVSPAPVPAQVGPPSVIYKPKFTTDEQLYRYIYGSGKTTYANDSNENKLQLLLRFQPLNKGSDNTKETLRKDIETLQKLIPQKATGEGFKRPFKPIERPIERQIEIKPIFNHNRFEILKGEIIAGNDSKDILKEFKKMLHDAVRKRLISHEDLEDYLDEIDVN